jgi:hypothetical protein
LVGSTCDKVASYVKMAGVSLGAAANQLLRFALMCSS